MLEWVQKLRGNSFTNVSTGLMLSWWFDYRFVSNVTSQRTRSTYFSIVKLHTHAACASIEWKKIFCRLWMFVALNKQDISLSPSRYLDLDFSTCDDTTTSRKIQKRQFFEIVQRSGEPPLAMPIHLRTSALAARQRVQATGGARQNCVHRKNNICRCLCLSVPSSSL